jgi:16S rRNA (uracil1498-N3)-methyltransferase
MSAHRFFLIAELRQGGVHTLPLAEADVHHAADVLRLREGETIEVVGPDSRVWTVKVAAATRAGVRGEVQAEIAVDALPRVTLFQGVAKGDKMDDIVRQAVEVGAEAIVPILTARCVVQLDARKRASRGERWRRVAEAAAKQSKRVVVPEVLDPVRLRDALPLLADFDAAVVLWEESRGSGLREALCGCVESSDARVAVIVGPEGGLAAEEVSALEAVGVTTASLGPTIMRTETAAVVAVALAIEALGGLGASRE